MLLRLSRASLVDWVRGRRLVGCLGVVVVVACVVPSAASADPSGTAVVSPNPLWESPSLYGFDVANGGAGLSWDVNGGTGESWSMQYQSFSGGGVETFGSSSPVPIAGQIEDGVTADPQADSGDPGLVTSVQLEPLGGGTPTVVTLASNETYLGFNGAGVLLAQNTTSGVNVVLRVSGAADQVLCALGQGSMIGSPLVDDGGMLFGFQPSGATSGPIDQVWYVDFGSDAATLENTDPQDSYAVPKFMTATAIGWGSTVSNDGINLAWQSRSGGAQSRLTIGFGGADPQGISLSGSTIAFTANNGNQRYNLYLEPSDGSASPTLVTSTLGANNVTALPTGGFAVLNDPAPADPTIETVSTAGTFTPFAALSPIAAVAEQISLSGGRLAFLDGSDAPSSLGAALSSLPTTKTGATVTLGTETLLATDAATQILTSDDRTAYVANTTAQKELVVFDGAAEEFSTPLASTAAVVAFSGDDVLLHTVNTSAWSVVNVATGASTPLTTADAWIWGPYVYYQGTKGQILRLNLTQPASATNPYQVRVGDGCGIDPGQFLAWNTWVGFVCSNGAKLHYDEVINTATNKVIPLTGFELTELGDGVVAWYSGGVVEVMNLDSSTHPITAIGDLAPSPYPQLMALDSSGGQDVAWLAPDERIHIAPIPVPAAKPALLDDIVPTTITPGGPWDASFDLSKPVSWKITIKTSAGKTAFQTTKAAANDGSIRFVWNGQTASGKTEPAGTYTWKLTVTGLDGVGSLSETGTLTIS